MKHLQTGTSTSGDTHTWAMRQFGNCALGDTRRTKRLVDYAARQAARPAASTNAVCGGDDAVAEGVYRWLRNDRVSPEAIVESSTQATVHACEGRDVVLAIQDTSTFVFSHAVAQELGRVSAVSGHSVRGILVHSTLMVDATTREPLGLVDLEQWTRHDDDAKESHKKRAGHDKESIKWQHATERMRTRYGDQPNVITVCDREADVYDYLTYLVDTKERFVIRAASKSGLADLRQTAGGCDGDAAGRRNPARLDGAAGRATRVGKTEETTQPTSAHRHYVGSDRSLGGGASREPAPWSRIVSGSGRVPSGKTPPRIATTGPNGY